MSYMLYMSHILKLKTNDKHDILTNLYNHRIQKYNNTYNQFSHELSLFIDSYDESRSRNQFKSIVSNYSRKITKDIFDVELSLVGTRNLFNTVVKEYNQIITDNDSSSELFINLRTIDKEQREFVCIDLCFDVLNEILNQSMFNKNEQLEQKTSKVIDELKSYLSSKIMNGGV